MTRNLAKQTSHRSKTEVTEAGAPRPILLGLDEMTNPHRETGFDVRSYFDGPPLRGGDTDYEYSLKFLYSYNGSSATFNAYRRELERLLQWCWRIEQKPAHKLQRDDIEAFIKFTANPPIDWIGEKNVARFLTVDGEKAANPAWRPFVMSLTKAQREAGQRVDPKTYAPSQAAIKASFAVLSSFYDYLLEEQIVDANPVARIRQKSKFLKTDQNAALVRRITNLQWDYVIDIAEEMADDDPARHERTLFIMNCLFALYLRISELVADERSTPVMGDFRKDQDGHWWFRVTGKGNKDRRITVSDAMLDALKRYRRSRGLSALPAINDPSPLIISSRGGSALTSTRQVRRIVQECFDAAYQRMRDDGLEEDAAELRTATVHWLRHTGISEDVKIRPREHVRDDAGHASMATTDRYIESDMRERHATARKKPLKDL